MSEIVLYPDSAHDQTVDASTQHPFSRTLALRGDTPLRKALLYVSHRTKQMRLLEGEPLPIIDASARTVLLELKPEDLIYPGILDVYVIAKSNDGTTQRYPGGTPLRLSVTGETRRYELGTLTRAIEETFRWRQEAETFAKARADGTVILSSALPVAHDHRGEVWLVVDERSYYRSNGATWSQVGTAIAGTTADGELTDVPVTRAATIDDLRSKRPSPNMHRLVEGYYAAGDGGGGVFVWRSGDATTPDDGIVVGSNATGYGPGEAREGRWHRVWDGRTVQAAWFGAGLPDSADGEDSSRLQTSADAVPDGGVWVLDGDYWMTYRVDLTDRNVAVDARGGTFVMANGDTYQAFWLGGTDSAATVQHVNWIGGHFDGNKAKMNWTSKVDGTIRGTGTVASPGPGGLVTFARCDNAVAQGISAQDHLFSVLYAVDCEQALFDSCYCWGGGSPAHHYPGTFSGRYTTRLVVRNCTADGGNIGFVYTTPSPPADSKFILKNVTARNQYQSSIHNECAETMIVDGFECQANAPDHSSLIHINNDAKYTWIKNGRLVNDGCIDFNNAPGQKVGLVENVEIRGCSGETAIVNATHVINCRLISVHGNGVSGADVVRDTRIDGFGSSSYGAGRCRLVDNCVIRGGHTPVANCERVRDCKLSDCHRAVDQTNIDTCIVESCEMWDVSHTCIRGRMDPGTARRTVVRDCHLRDWGKASSTRGNESAGVASRAQQVIVTGCYMERTDTEQDWCRWGVLEQKGNEMCTARDNLLKNLQDDTSRLTHGDNNVVL